MNCSFEPEITLDEWAGRLLEPLRGGRYPLSASIELTERCNYACQHCYINQPPADPTAKARELSAAGWISILDTIADAGCFFLLITGGEPLLRPDFLDFFRHARQRGMLVTLFSNASMLTPAIADALAEWGLHSLEVSLYGATRETYETVTGLPGSFDRAQAGIRLALEKGLKTHLKSVLLTTNLHELQAMKDATENFGLTFRYDGTIWPRLNGSLEPMRYKVSDETMLTLDQEDPDRFKSWQETARSFDGVLLRAEKVFTCGAGYRSFHINAQGQMSPCIMAREPSFNLPRMDFMQAWQALGEIHTWKRQLRVECESCTAAALCQQCPGWSLAVHGNYETPVNEICALGRLRSELLSVKMNY